MTSLAKILILILLCFVSIFKTHAQLSKDWGIYLSDTTLSIANGYSRFHGMQCDSADNIYVQYQNTDTDYDALIISCISKDGIQLWSREYSHQENGKSISTNYSSLYKWGDRIIALQPIYYDDSAFIYSFNEISPVDGNILNNWSIPNPAGISMHSIYNGYAIDNGKINKKGQVFMSGYFFQNVNVMNMVRFDLPSQSSKATSFGCFDGTFQANSPSCHMININDSLFAFSSPIRFPNWNTGVQINVVKKDDLSFFSVINSNENITMQNAVIYGNKVRLNGGTIFELNLKDKTMQRVVGNGSRSIEQDRWGGIYLNPYSTARILKLNNNLSDTLWEQHFKSPLARIKYGELQIMTSKNIHVTYPVNRFIRKEDFGDLYYGFGLTTTSLNNQGEMLDTHTELFDTTLKNQWIEPFIQPITDNKGNIIRLVPVVKRRDSLYNRSFYLYKLCIDCEQNNFQSPPMVDRFENHLRIIQNPAKDQLNYKFGIVTKGRLNFTIVNAAGQEIYRESHNRFQKGLYQQSIDISSFLPGVYILNMNTAYENYAVKFIVQP